MVKKLIKHEFTAMGRLLLPMYIILLGLSVITRIILFFENDSVIYSIISGSAIFVLALGLVAGTMYTVVSSIIRFYKNLFSKEGYLTFTLPVTVEAHLFTKLLVAVVSYLSSFAVIFGAFCIATSGELLVEIFKAADFLFGKAFESLGANLIIYIAEIIVYALVSCCSGFMLYYACMCIGQLAKRSRVLLAIGVYFGYYYITQILVTLCMVLFSVFAESDFMIDLSMWIYNNAILAGHLFLIALISGAVIMGAVYYLIAHSIMKKKLNLE